MSVNQAYSMNRLVLLLSLINFFKQYNTTGDRFVSYYKVWIKKDVKLICHERGTKEKKFESPHEDSNLAPSDQGSNEVYGIRDQGPK